MALLDTAHFHMVTLAYCAGGLVLKTEPLGKPLHYSAYGL